MKSKPFSALVSSLVATLAVAMIFSTPLARAEDPAPLAPPVTSDVPMETGPVAPVAPADTGMGSFENQAPTEEAPPVERHTRKKKKKAAKKSAKKKKKAGKSAKHSKKKKKKRHHSAE